jgi:hypothetical protein
VDIAAETEAGEEGPMKLPGNSVSPIAATSVENGAWSCSRPQTLAKMLWPFAAFIHRTASRK